MSFYTVCLALGLVAGMSTTKTATAVAAAAPIPSKSTRRLTLEAQQDEVQKLPGWDKPLPSRMFAGFVDAGEADEGGTHYKMHEHYFLVESEGDPVSDPLLIWTNGGP